MLRANIRGFSLSLSRVMSRALLCRPDSSPFIISKRHITPPTCLKAAASKCHFELNALLNGWEFHIMGHLSKVNWVKSPYTCLDE